MTPLNPYLYQLLTQTFGRPPVISNQGEPFTYDVVTTPRGPRMKARGEQYAVCCPDCQDTRNRLYFHHRFGTRIGDPRFPGALVDLCFCQHEQRKKSKWYSLLGARLSDPSVALQIQLQTQDVQQQGPARHVPLTMGDVTPLRELPPGHPALLYLQGRGYEPTYLSDCYGACLINAHLDERVDRMARDRIGFPFVIDGRLVTWQARLAYDLPKGQKFPPKWYFPPGSKALWGYDVARRFPVVVICEGILSAVNFGPAGVAIGGKTLLYSMRQLLVAGWKHAVVALDPDAGLCREEGKPDYQQRVIDQLREEGMNVVGVQWTPGDLRDPGDLRAAGCLQLLRRSCPQMLELLPYFGG